MKVSDLITALQVMSQDAPVLIELVSETDGDRYLCDIDPPELAWVDRHNVRSWNDQARDHEAVILK